MPKKIYLPNAEESARLIENAWQDFAQKLKERNANTNDEVLEFVHDMFAAGYAYGWSDCLNIIRGQMEMDQLTDQLN